MTCTIKSLSERAICPVAELEEALSQRYRGQHVAVQYVRAATSMKKAVMISIDEQGKVASSSTGQPVDFALIADEIQSNPSVTTDAQD